MSPKIINTLRATLAWVACFMLLFPLTGTNRTHFANGEPAPRTDVTVTVCGTVTAYVAATDSAVGAITIGGSPFVIAAGTVISNSDLIRIGANLCLLATLNASLQIVPPSEVRANVTTSVSICGVVSVFIGATTTSNGYITIGGQNFEIAAGTVITNQEQIRIGLEFCLNATINVFLQIVPPSIIFPPRPNNPPTLNVPGPQTVQAGSTLSFNVSGSDPDAGDTVTLSASNVPANATFNQASGNPASGQFTFAPSQSQAGQTFTVDFTARDSHAASVSRSVQITVTSGSGNHPPTLSLPGPQTVQVGGTLTFTASASDQDSGDTVTLTATNIPANASVTPNPVTGNPATSQFSFSPSQSQAGQTFTVNYNATDSQGGSGSGFVQITVTSGPPPGTNNPPVISVPGPQTIEVGRTLTFTVSASDPDGDAVTLSAGSVPANASFNPATGRFTLTPSSSQAGQTFVVTFTATDSRGASASANVPITVVTSGGGAPGPPIISVPPSPIIVQVGQRVDFVVSAISPIQDCRVVISASGLPTNSIFDSPSGRFSFMPLVEQRDKSFIVVFTATDCIGQTAVGRVEIRVIGGPGEGNIRGTICVPVTKIFFAAANPGEACGFVIVSVFNTGVGPLRIHSMTFREGRHFRMEGASTFPFMLQSAGAMQLKIVFQPKESGSIYDTLTLATDDPNNPTVTIILRGKGRQ